MLGVNIVYIQFPGPLTPPPSGDKLLLEDGFYLLLEDGSKLLFE